MTHFGRPEGIDSVREALSNSTGALKSIEILEISKYNPPQWFCSTSLFSLTCMIDHDFWMILKDFNDFSMIFMIFHVFDPFFMFFWEVGKIKESEKSLSEVVSFF